MSESSGIPFETVQEDIKRALIHTALVSHERDREGRGAFMVLHHLQLIHENLRTIGMLQLIYLADSIEDSPIPRQAYELIEQYAERHITQSEAEQELSEMIRSYKAAFAEMGITPSRPEVTFSNITGIPR